MKRHDTARALLVLLSVTVSPLHLGASVAQAPAEEALIEPVAGPAPRATAGFGEPDARTATIRVRPELLSEAPGAAAATHAVVPFGDADLRFHLAPADDPSEGRIWTGTLAGGGYGTAHFRRVGGSLAGSIRYRGGLIRILPRGPGRAVAVRVNGPPLPDVALPLPERLRRTPEHGAPPPMSIPGDKSTIDLIVILERRAKVEAGSSGGWLESMVRTSVIDLNQALANSGVEAEFRLLAIKRDRFRQEGDDGDYMYRLLRATTDTEDAEMRRVPRLRRRFGADLVAVVMGRTTTDICGMAWIAGQGGGVLESDADGAFSVTSWRCLVRDLLPHEIGHNMGGQHGHADPIAHGAGAYDYSYGHKVSPGFRTVMAYSCSFCSPLLHFSNPDVLVDGVPTGVAGGPSAAANAWGFERDRAVIASFRKCERRCGKKDDDNKE